MAKSLVATALLARTNHADIAPRKPRANSAVASGAHP
jgi:hypothetical protein